MIEGTVLWPDEIAASYRTGGLWRGELLGARVREHALSRPTAVALVDERGRWTYAELEEWVVDLAAGFAELGLLDRDRVVVQLPNTAELVVTLLAFFRLGVVPVMSQPAHRWAELEAIARVSEAVGIVFPDRVDGTDYRPLARKVRESVPSVQHLVVAGETNGDDLVRLGTVCAAGLELSSPPRRHAHAKECCEVFTLDAEPCPVNRGHHTGRHATTPWGPDPSDLALLQLSSATTQTPRLVGRTHDDYLLNVRQSVPLAGLRPDSVVLITLPAAHNLPASAPGFLGALDVGATVVLCPSPDTDVAFPIIERERVTMTSLVPPLAQAWIDEAELGEFDLSSLEVVQVGGARLSPELARRFRPVLGCTLQQVYGMAEGLVCCTRLDDPDEVVTTTQGRPMRDTDEIRVVDDHDCDVPDGEVGHLIVRGPSTIRGYFRDPEHDVHAFTEDGYYRTGDLVRRTPTGHLVVEGRSKEQINRGGDKIAPEEIENHLLAHPAVHGAAVVGVPDDHLGEQTCAWVVAHGDRPSDIALGAFLRGRGLAAYKLPDRYEIRTSFPPTPAVARSRAELRRMVQRALASLVTPGASGAARDLRLDNIDAWTPDLSTFPELTRETVNR